MKCVMLCFVSHFTLYFYYLCVLTINITHRVQFHPSPPPFSISFWKFISFLIHVFISFFISLFFSLFVFNFFAGWWCTMSLLIHITSLCITLHHTTHDHVSHRFNTVQYTFVLRFAWLHFTVLNNIHIHFLICLSACLSVCLFVA